MGVPVLYIVHLRRVRLVLVRFWRPGNDPVDLVRPRDQVAAERDEISSDAAQFCGWWQAAVEIVIPMLDEQQEHWSNGVAHVRQTAQQPSVDFFHRLAL
jgi:hypothetical protein